MCYSKLFFLLPAAGTPGLFAQVFTDFGTKFKVFDTTGEQPISTMVASVTQEEEGVVAALDEVRHGLEDGDYVTFSEVEGMTELNGCKPMKIKVRIIIILNTNFFSDLKNISYKNSSAAFPLIFSCRP